MRSNRLYRNQKDKNIEAEVTRSRDNCTFIHSCNGTISSACECLLFVGNRRNAETWLEILSWVPHVMKGTYDRKDAKAFL